jgi:hypothetical protein
MRQVSIIVLLFVLGAAPTGSGQTTRTELIEQQQAEKAAQLEPYQPGRIERIIVAAEDGKLRRTVTPYNGFFAEYGYTYKPIGSGTGFGGGFRHDLLDRRARLVLEAGASFRKYRMARADFSLPRLARGRVELGVEGVYRRHTQDDFYGLGHQSETTDRVSFGMTGREFQGRAAVAVTPWLTIGGRGGWLSPLIDEGSDDRFPSIEERFDDTTAPGLQAQPDFVYEEGFAQVDYRDEPGNSRAGGYYLLTIRKYHDRELSRYSFRSVGLLLQQFVPVFDKKRVFAFQVGLAGTNPSASQEVPFYMQPTLGGSRTLRSDSDYRFRDQQAVWASAEYRWEAFSALDMALFTDWGNVTPTLSDLNFTDLKHAYGIGFRFNSPEAVFFRVDIATGGGEGVRYFFKFSKAF